MNKNSALPRGSQPTMKSIKESNIRQLQELGTVHRDVPLSNYSRWKIGGNADCVIAPDTADSVAKLMRYVAQQGLPYVIVGSSSNLLFDDEGVHALVILLGTQMQNIKIEGGKVWAQCGAWVPRFAKKVADAGLSGSEHMAGIPGTLGGLICMNGGSQRKGVGDQLLTVRSVSPDGELVTWTKEQCSFAYRSSIFQSNQHLIVDAKFEYPSAADKSEVKRTMLRILRERRTKFPQKLPNCGSVFVSNPAMYADYGPPGAVIERCGLKGLQRGSAQISPMHANFIVNNGGASAKDVLYLINLIRSKVENETGYSMPAEARFVSPNGKITPAHEKAHQLYGVDDTRIKSEN